MLESIDCTIYLLSLQQGTTPSDFLHYQVNTSSIIAKGRPHGWVHQPHHHDKSNLLSKAWDLFLLVEDARFTDFTKQYLISSTLSVKVAVPREQYDTLISQRNSTPEPIRDTPPLPDEWIKSNDIPKSAVLEANKSAPLDPGELRLDPSMSSFLSTALPSHVADKPVTLFNLFKYPSGDHSVHEAYMEGFKNKFGPAAGARVKFMGPVKSAIKTVAEEAVSNSTTRWDDANLVQYDSIWHYAYMLSTDVYKELNKEKVRGLEDTCILVVSEVELVKSTA